MAPERPDLRLPNERVERTFAAPGSDGRQERLERRATVVGWAGKRGEEASGRDIVVAHRGTRRTPGRPLLAAGSWRSAYGTCGSRVKIDEIRLLICAMVSRGVREPDPGRTVGGWRNLEAVLPVPPSKAGIGSRWLLTARSATWLRWRHRWRFPRRCRRRCCRCAPYRRADSGADGDARPLARCLVSAWVDPPRTRCD